MRHQLAESFGLLCPEILFFGPKKGVEKTKSGKPRRNAIFEKYLEGVLETSLCFQSGRRTNSC